MKFNIRIMTNLGGMGSQEPYKESKTGGEEKESLIMLQVERVSSRTNGCLERMY